MYVFRVRSDKKITKKILKKMFVKYKIGYRSKDKKCAIVCSSNEPMFADELDIDKMCVSTGLGTVWDFV